MIGKVLDIHLTKDYFYLEEYQLEYVYYLCLYGFITNRTKDFILSIFIFFIFLGLSFGLFFNRIKLLFSKV